MPWRPPQWQSQAPQKVIITFPGLGQAPQYSQASGLSVTLPPGQTLYAFDAEIQIEHQQQLRKTEHPVQTGASITDHAYLEPARLILDVGMSDAMDAYFVPSTWTGAQSKSVAAYQTVLALQFARVPLTITTRLRTYLNMLIENPVANETHKTAHGLRMRIEFGQIFLASISVVTASARPNETNETGLATVTTTPPTAAQVSQYNVLAPGFAAGEAALASPVVPSSAIGSGPWCSVNTNNLSNLPAGK